MKNKAVVTAVKAGDIILGAMSGSKVEATVSTHKANPHLLWRLLRFVLLDIIKNRMVLLYTLFLAAVASGLFLMSDDAVKGLASLLNIVLLITPLLSLVFSAIYIYNSYEFIELLAAQPLRRRTILLSQFLGLGISLSLALLIGLGIPALLFGFPTGSLSLLISGAGLTLCFVSLALIAALWTRDKARGIGLAVMLWFFFSVIYDALVLMLMFAFADYPLENFMLVMVALNPIDLARVSVLLQMDISALMGYTGALFREVLGNTWGTVLAAALMGLWTLIPLLAALRKFSRRDF
jgi:Cu-processing system permease protein